MVLAFNIILFSKEKEEGRQRYGSYLLCSEWTILAACTTTIGTAQGF
jgi:hypothetical protein